MSVYEIEQLIQELSAINPNDDTDKERVEKEIRNWQTVLTNYRNEKDDSELKSLENTLDAIMAGANRSERTVRRPIIFLTRHESTLPDVPRQVL